MTVGERLLKNKARQLTNLACPFCGETEFDGYGLKRHIQDNNCDVCDAVTKEMYDDPLELHE